MAARDARHSKPTPRRLAVKVAGQFLAGGLVMVALLAGLAEVAGVRWHAGVLPESVRDAVFVSLGAAVVLFLIWRQLRRDWPAEAPTPAVADPPTQDYLTDLPDREGLRAALDARLKSDRDIGRAALVLLELRGLAVVNDTRGLAVGDALIGEIAARLNAAFGPESEESGVVARLSGDEFALLLDVPAGSDPGEAGLRAAQRAVAKVDQPVVVPGHTLHVGGRAGVAVGDPEIDGPGPWLQRADLALSHARSDSTDPVCLFEPVFAETARAQAQLESELRAAVEQKQFELHYQAKVDLAEGWIVGAEALVRWRHPAFGLQMPGRFIEVAERSGLMVPIGSWVLRSALKEAASWPAVGGHRPHVAINVSAVQFADPHFESYLDAALAESGIDPARVVLEMTESMLQLHSHALVERLHGLRARGLGLSIDDFGTGYSALAYLKRYPVSELKVDRAFVTTLPEDPYDHALVGAIQRLASALDMPVTAEGVETRAQAEALGRLGYTRAQGFLYAMPLARADFAWLLRNHPQLPVEERAPNASEATP
ncbi:MAG: bifunctional diguanylate cyclase/phosphodiesterase [Rhodovibrio sp.]|nr:bifunctional diguanylate cyclase/phosphodiesterase [Rhodovibrio sp.]